ncbi:hypothetical protein [Rufibacter roseus]|uniref:Uncharacterized protein n=1 Tax=Rufibacter roseus TaxID=1567108 RepID=A0ABW2DMG2_9BACT|nr:hypothetical protein [Rufibacter roseus]
MKKLLAMLLLAGSASFYACQPEKTGTVGVETEDASQTDNQYGIVNPQENDTSNADVIEKTQTNVGNSRTRGEENNSNSQTTKNVVVRPDSTRQ